MTQFTVVLDEPAEEIRLRLAVMKRDLGDNAVVTNIVDQISLQLPDPIPDEPIGDVVVRIGTEYYWGQRAPEDLPGYYWRDDDGAALDWAGVTVGVPTGSMIAIYDRRVAATVPADKVRSVHELWLAGDIGTGDYVERMAALLSKEPTS